MSRAQPGARRALRALDRRVAQTLPQPAYDYLKGGYQTARKLAGRDPERVLPDFVIIGAAKGGTTSLYGWLIEHPFVEPASQKEVHYFDYNYQRGEEWYRRHFRTQRLRRQFTAEHGRPFLTGEASPSYLSHLWAPARLAKLLPDAKLLVTLRNPVDRAYSQFQMSRREGEEPLESFAEAVAIEDERLAPEHEKMKADDRYQSWPIGCWSYLLRGRYAEQLEHWFELFPRENFHFVTLESLAAEPQQTMDGVHEFLGLPAHRYPGLERLHAAHYDSLGSDTGARLAEYFRPHNERLYELVGIDFGWEKPRS